MFEFLTKERSGYIFGNIGKYKAWEIEVGKFKEWNWFDFKIRWTRHCDHAGFELFLELLGFWINFHIYDGRHWKYDEKRYYFPGEALKEWEDDILEDYQKIKDGKFIFHGVKKFVDDTNSSWKERFQNLEEHHLKETRAYINKLESVYQEFEEYLNTEK